MSQKALSPGTINSKSIHSDHDNADIISRSSYGIRYGLQESDAQMNKPVPFLNMRENSRRHSQFYKYSKISGYGINNNQTKYSRHSINDDSDNEVR